MLSYVREYTDDERQRTDRVLCVNNLSRFPQPVELDLRRFEGVAPIELLGGVRFPEIGELPYLLTLGAYGFYWFRLPPAREDRRRERERRRRMSGPGRLPGVRPLVRRQGPRAPGRRRCAGSGCSRATTPRASASSW